MIRRYSLTLEIETEAGERVPNERRIENALEYSTAAEALSTALDATCRLSLLGEIQ